MDHEKQGKDKTRSNSLKITKIAESFYNGSIGQLQYKLAQWLHKTIYINNNLSMTFVRNVLFQLQYTNS
jgi:hypothetical protein